MASRARTPNHKLAALYAETHWNLGEFARAVNRVGTETGRRLKYDESAVSHWLSGTRPMAKYRPVVLEALSRKLGRQVTAFEAGFADQPDIEPEATDTVAGLIDLGSMDMDPSRRGVLAGGLYSVALTIPGWPDVLSRFERIKTNPHTRIGMAEVESVIAMTERISELDDQFGGRTARPMAAAFMVNNIAPYLQATASDSVRKAMLSAAADHLYLTGYMAVDERLDMLGQSYYMKALELAGAAGDHLTYCTTLRGMSVQAVELGHGAAALRYANAASAASPEAGPRMRAFLAGQQAHAAAQTGDRRGAWAMLREAEVAMEKAEAKAKAHGSYDPASLSYHVSQVSYELGDREGAIRALEQSEKVRPTVYRRARVRHRSMLAEWKLEAGRLEEAVQTWHLALDDYPHVQSGRTDDRFRAMLSALRPHARNPHVRELSERARPLATARRI
ncbi:tetratricopeptide repeat protein [Streptomyces sudanensis]|uniref:tetratricopeptide repeat protein n=1 Tax=Streptomyces sudanensis TaxID=436397 RepID=UPI0020CF93BB|nr:tetratricopeptide repeat protein [Streptomyces sudanensis]MCP9988108.1 tetratricopeptide repeat protein [Streptomyces sudanensis]